MRRQLRDTQGLFGFMHSYIADTAPLMQTQNDLISAKLLHTKSRQAALYNLLREGGAVHAS